jgi:hypothetical protein
MAFKLGHYPEFVRFALTSTRGIEWHKGIRRDALVVSNARKPATKEEPVPAAA